MTRSLLIELGCEELPANACRVAEREAGSTIEKLLAEHRRKVPVHVELVLVHSADLGVPTGTVMSRLFYARQKLRALLAPRVQA